MQQVGAGGKGICFACAEDAKPKTGTTVVVTEASPDAKGKVTIRNVNTNEIVTQDIPEATLRQTFIPKDNEIVLSFNLDELSGDSLIPIVIQKAYSALDMMPFKTIGDAKKVMAIQEHLLSLVKERQEKRKYTKRDKPPQEGTPDKSRTQTSSAD